MTSMREQLAEEIFLDALRRVERLGVEVRMDCANDESITLGYAERLYNFVAIEEPEPEPECKPKITLEIEHDYRYGFNYFVFRYCAPEGSISSRSFSWQDGAALDHVQEISRQFSKSIQKSLHSIKT